jgi:ribose 5-phosphate isomerase B
MKIAFGCDHAGWALKSVILEHLSKKGIEVIDLGTDSALSVDYPDFALKVAQVVVSNQADYGMLVCGTGLGMAISANKIKGVRAVTVTESFSAFMARAHNDANVLALGARVTGPGIALQIIDVFLATPFEHGRHLLRVNKIRNLETLQEGKAAC